MFHSRIIKKIVAVLLVIVLCGTTVTAVLMAMDFEPERAESGLQPLVVEQDLTLQPAEEGEMEAAVWAEDLLYTERASHFQKPSRMRAVFLTPGVDFMTGSSEADWRKEIDAALEEALSLSMNTVIVHTRLEDRVIYTSSRLPSVSADFDPMAYLIERAGEAGLYLYAELGVLWTAQGDKLTHYTAVAADALDAIRREFGAFAKTYPVDGILLDDYYLEDTQASYLLYRDSGMSGGVERYLFDSTEAAILAALRGIRSSSATIQAGLLTSAVWANESANEEGSESDADFQSLIDGHTDIRELVASSQLDFVFVGLLNAITDSKEPFTTLAEWWNTTFEGVEIPFYGVQASEKVGSDIQGWGYHDQLVRQVIRLEEREIFQGTSFTSLASLLENPEGATDALVSYFNEETSAEAILRVLYISKPEQTVYTTHEPSVQFLGASDPNFEVLYNGEPLETNDNGYFSVDAELEAGENVFTFSHKGRTATYTITREIRVIDSVLDQAAAVAGGSQITVWAFAYEDASVTATLAGQTITLTPDTILDDSIDIESNYRRYSGTFTVPAATDAEQNLGAVSYRAEWQGYSSEMQGGTVTVQKRMALGEGLGSGTAVQIVNAYAETFPTDVLNDNSTPTCYPLPAGTIDYLASGLLTYGEHSYYILQSGKRVYAEDVSPIGDASYGDNQISGIAVQNTGTYTELQIQNLWNAPFSIALDGVGYKGGENYEVTRYAPTSVTITFDYATAHPDGVPALDGVLFSSGSWSTGTVDGRPVVTLTLALTGRFGGVTSSYDQNGLLTLRFANPRSLAGTTILLDPGHGGSDVGASAPTGITEAQLNQNMASLVASELRAMGANVVILNTSGGMTLRERMAAARSYPGCLFVSLHHNSGSATAYGPEVYYFNSFSMPLAQAVYQQLNQAAGSVYGGSVNYNRDYKFYRYRVTLPQEHPSILVEYGFLSNPNEAMRLVDPSVQQLYARATAQGIANYFYS